jgi:hypothetical protein
MFEATRGLGILFLNVTDLSTTCISYFNGSYQIGHLCAAAGPYSFAGELYGAPVVTSVTVQLGTARIFSWDGTSAPVATTATGNDLVTGQDIVLAEPANTQPSLSTIAGQPLNATVDTFSDTDPLAIAPDFNASISWGDGSQGAGAVSGTAASFTVTGTHTYMRAGVFTVQTAVSDLGGSTQSRKVTVVVGLRTSSTTVACSPSPVAVTHPTSCLVTVSDTGRGRGSRRLALSTSPPARSARASPWAPAARSCPPATEPPPARSATSRSCTHRRRPG